MAKICLIYEDEGASTYYRTVLPCYHLHEELAAEGIHLEMAKAPDPTIDTDWMIFHRAVPLSWFPVIAELRARGTKIVWDLDDDMFQIPEHNPAHKHFPPVRHPELRLCLGWAEHLTVTTSRLATNIAGHGAISGGGQAALLRKTRVLPNLIDPQDYSHLTPNIPEGGPCKILWGGSVTHRRDLAILTPVVRQLVSHFGRDVHFIFVNQAPEGLDDIKPENLTALVGSPLASYPNLLSLLGCHLGLCPLEDTSFNRAKSAIKWMEMTLGGMAVVASAVGPYADAIDDAETGYVVRAGGTPRDLAARWLSSLESVIEHREIRASLQGKAQRAVIDGHSWQSTAARGLWLDFFRGLARQTENRS